MTMMTLKIDIEEYRYHKIIVTVVIIVTLSQKIFKEDLKYEIYR